MVVISVTIGFLAIVAAGIAATAAVSRLRDHTEWVIHTYEVERAILSVDNAIANMRSGRRGYLLNRSDQARAQFLEARDDLFLTVEKLSRLTKDNPAQQAYIPEIRQNARTLASLLKTNMDGIDLSRTDVTALTAVDPTVAAVADNLGRISQAMMKEENRLLEERHAARQWSINAFFVMIAVGGILVAIVAVGSVFVIRRYTDDLMRSRDDLANLNENLEEAVEARTTDLQRANDEIQRFAYIVSHDLRSPLVNVMGFTAELDAATKPLKALIDAVEEQAPELLTDDARDAAREDLPEAVGFIRTSTQKMDRLINAILRLSREGRRTIAPERLDMNRLFQVVTDSLKHRTDELGVEIIVAPHLPQIVSDRVAVEQIISNLVENAVKYLKPGRPGLIEVFGEVHGDRAIFSIKDNGRGIDPQDHQRVFDLFRRSGVQDQPGEGIGLAHVRASAYRLGGTIVLQSRLDEGATFSVNLPMVFAGPLEKAT